MIRYINNIIIPYVERVRQLLSDRKPALIIMDNFKGQVTPSVSTLLEDHDIHVCLLPPNTTDLLQPMDISVNKPAKDFLRRKFQEWYSEQVMKQLEGVDIETCELEPIDLSLSVLKEVGAKWLVEMAKYFEDNPMIIVNGFIRSGITGALDGVETDSMDDEPTDEESVDSEEELAEEAENLIQ